MSADVDNTADHRARLVVVERGLSELKESVGELTRNVTRWIQQQSQAPRPVPFKEIIATAAATLVVFAGIIKFFDDRMDATLREHKYRVERLEQAIAPPKTVYVVPRQ